VIEREGAFLVARRQKASTWRLLGIPGRQMRCGRIAGSLHDPQLREELLSMRIRATKSSRRHTTTRTDRWSCTLQMRAARHADAAAWSGSPLGCARGTGGAGFPPADAELIRMLVSGGPERGPPYGCVARAFQARGPCTNGSSATSSRTVRAETGSWLDEISVHVGERDRPAERRRPGAARDLARLALSPDRTVAGGRRAIAINRSRPAYAPRPCPRCSTRTITSCPT
jgi:hypothetical protein